MTLSNLKARTALAADLARVDRQRFNEAVAENFYPCAPKTVRGATRVFDVNDIIVLWVYGRLLRKRMAPRYAGEVACELRQLLNQHPEENRVVYVINSHDSGVWLRREALPLDHNTIGGASIVSAEDWFLEFTRQRIIQELQEEATTLGARDESDAE